MNRPFTRRARRQWARLTGTAIALSSLALAGCGTSSSSTHADAAALNGSALHQQCTQVADVLSDGPDPGADPVGYAEAQILPLRQLHLDNQKLQKAVTALDHAYADLNAKHPGTSVALQVSKDQTAVNAICPQAAP